MRSPQFRKPHFWKLCLKLKAADPINFLPHYTPFVRLILWFHYPTFWMFILPPEPSLVFGNLADFRERIWQMSAYYLVLSSSEGIRELASQSYYWCSNPPSHAVCLHVFDVYTCCCKVGCSTSYFFSAWWIPHRKAFFSWLCWRFWLHLSLCPSSDPLRKRHWLKCFESRMWLLLQLHVVYSFLWVLVLIPSSYLRHFPRSHWISTCLR